MMRSLVRKLVVMAVAVSFSVSMTGCATYQVHPEFKERHKNIKSVSIMPPEVDAYILTFQGDRKVLKDLIPIMGKTTVSELEKIMSNKGYELKKLDLSEEALSKDANLKTSFFHVNELFKKSLEDITKRKQPNFTYTMGSDINTFANLSTCDILIFTKEDGIKKSAGEIAKDVAKGLAISAACLLIGAIYIPIPQTAATLVHVAVVDGNDGAILWYNNNACSSNYDPENQKQLAGLINSLIGPFPDSLFKTKGSVVKGGEKENPIVVAPKPAEVPSPAVEAPKPAEAEATPKTAEEAPKPIEEAPKPAEEAPKSIEATNSGEAAKPTEVTEPTVAEAAKPSEEAPKSTEEAPKVVEEMPKSVEEAAKPAVSSSGS